MNRCSSIASLVIGMALFLTLEEVSASWRHSPEDSDSIGNSALQSSVNEEGEPRISVGAGRSSSGNSFKPRHVHRKSIGSHWRSVEEMHRENARVSRGKRFSTWSNQYKD
ncbi:MAG: hypothetical protein DWH80_09150 [Planctomycetota bacterium]|nr:MAG: hypothetical protein DWH80_09150 [Planctomycetota bacterium]